MIFAFDLDDTLCHTQSGDYENSRPILHRIAKVNSLKAQGHQVIIFTARGSTRGIDFRPLTENQLADWGIKYDQLILGKPNFDLLVDDKAISSDSFDWDI